MEVECVIFCSVKHEITMASVDITSYANLVLLERLYAKQEHRQWMRERKNFLAEEVKKNGVLRCYYCGRDDLKINSKNRGDIATVDHFVPKSGGGDPCAHTNFRVCCSSCNKKKGSQHPDSFMSSKYLKNKFNAHQNYEYNRNIREQTCRQEKS